MSFTNFIFFALVCLSALVSSESVSCEHGNMKSGCTYSKQNEFSYLMFVQTWTGTYCRDGCCRLPSGISSLSTGFTIHGLWPNYESGYPTCCKSDFTSQKIEAAMQNGSTKRQISSHWPALKKCHFVQYETEKHGTCAANVYVGTTGLTDYWSAAIGLHGRWNIQDILRRKGITPSDSTAYTLSEIKSAISGAIGARANVVCDSQDSNLIAEVRICLARPKTTTEKFNLVPIDCPNSVMSSNCKEKHVIIPKIPNIPSGGCDW